MLRICPGDRSADEGEPVARARRVKRRPREQSAEWPIFPEAMLRICSGYRPADGGEPVARAGALCRPWEQSAQRHYFPVALLSAARAGEMPGRLFLRQRFKHHGHRVGAGVHIAAQAIAVQVRCAPGARFAGVKRTIRARLRRGESRLQVIRFGQQRR